MADRTASNRGGNRYAHVNHCQQTKEVEKPKINPSIYNRTAQPLESKNAVTNPDSAVTNTGMRK